MASQNSSQFLSIPVYVEKIKAPAKIWSINPIIPPNQKTLKDYFPPSTIGKMARKED